MGVLMNFQKAILSCFSLSLLALSTNELNAQNSRGVLPDELTAEEILDGKYLWPESPEVDIQRVGQEKGFMPDAFGKAPAVGIHPRLLFSEEDIPKIQERIKNTRMGTKSYANMKRRIALQSAEGTAYSNTLNALAAGDVEKAAALLADYKNAGKGPITSYHHRHSFVYPLLFDSFICLIENDKERGKKLAKATATLAKIYQARFDAMDAEADGTKQSASPIINDDGNQMHPNGELNSDVWRSGRRKAFDGDPFYVYAYDFNFKWMNETERSTCRQTINSFINGKTTMGSHMPHHFRNWNWVAIGAGGLLSSAAATLGEEGNDARVYQHARELINDYLTYGWSEKGASREAIAYTQFGLRWLMPAMVTLARNGDNLWNTDNWYKSLEWYAQSVQSENGRFLSHGDGGNDGVLDLTALMFKNAYPNSELADYVLAETLAGSEDPETDKGLMLFRTIFAVDPKNDLKYYKKGANLGLDLTHFDPERNQLITRSSWGPKMLKLNFECRADSFAPNHQHADRGIFSITGAGKTWGTEHFRGIESRHHSVVTIDYKGQGYFAPPGKWISLVDNEHATFGVCDSKYAYDWYFHPTLSGFADKNKSRRKYARWSRFVEDTDLWLKENPDFDWKANIDRTPQIEKYWSGFEKGDPRMWDEYSRPVRVPFNPVQKAFRTAGLIRGANPYVLIMDDIKKDDQAHTYDWNMMFDPDTELISIDTDEILLGSNTELIKGGFTYTFKRKGPKKASQLYIKVLERSIPKDVFHNPEIRLEAAEFKEARKWPEGRSYGLTKRLVIPSFSKEPKFKVLLFPHYEGEELPKIEWNNDRTEVKIQWKNQIDKLTFNQVDDGRTRIVIERNGKIISEVD